MVRLGVALGIDVGVVVDLDHPLPGVGADVTPTTYTAFCGVLA
jgi:hypothetical protein